MVAARKYSSGQSAPMIVYKSTDKVNWEQVFTSSTAYCNTNPRTRNTLLYWEAAGLFSVNTGDNIYFSATGEISTWKPTKVDNNNQGVLRGNGMIAAAGDYFVSTGGRATKFATPETVNDNNVPHYTYSDNTNIYARCV